MVTLEARRNDAAQYTEYHPLCSECGWNNSGGYVRAITDGAVAASTPECLAGHIADALAVARNHHRCPESP